MAERLRIALDGCAASGKTTVARLLARKLGLLFLDTGAMYRALAWKAIEDRLALDDEEGLGRMAASVDMAVRPQGAGMEILLEGRQVNPFLYTPEVNQAVPQVARVSAVRREMVRLQKLQAQRSSLVMVGRDIGTVVIPDAELKVFLTADLAERARRRWEELGGAAGPLGYDEVRQELADRDQQDREREDSPLVCAGDAHSLDSSRRTPDEVVGLIVELLGQEYPGE